MNEFTHSAVLKVMDEVVNECVPERAVIHIIDIHVLQMMDEVAKQHVLDDTCAPVIKHVTFALDDMPAPVIESTSSDHCLEEFANILDSCIELLTPMTAHTRGRPDEDLHGRQPVMSPAVQALTRALRCAMLCPDCCDQCSQFADSTMEWNAEAGQ